MISVLQHRPTLEICIRIPMSKSLPHKILYFIGVNLRCLNVKSVFMTFLKTIKYLCLVCIFICLCLSCNSDRDKNWFDNGATYMCYEYSQLGYPQMIGTCQRCGGMTASYAFLYCYDCAKKLNRCQHCGVER